MKGREKIYGVVGLGKFGFHVARRLAEGGAEIIACDIDQERVRLISDYVTKAYTLDATEERALKESGIYTSDVVIVSIGENIEANTLVVMQLMDLGVREIIAKAVNELHGKLLQKLGVSRIIHPERDMAERLAHSLLVGGFLEEISLAPGYGIYEIKPSSRMLDKSLKDIDLRKRYGLTVLLIKRGENMIINPSGNEVILEGDILVVLGKGENLLKID